MSQDIDSPEVIRNREIPGKAKQSEADYAKRNNLTRENTGGPVAVKEFLPREMVRRPQKDHQGHLSRSVEYTAGRNIDKGHIGGPTLSEQEMLLKANPKLVSTYKAAGFSDETIYDMLKDMQD